MKFANLIFSLVFTLGVVSSFAEEAAKESGFYVLPHLNNITQTGCTIIWESHGERKIGEVEYGEKGAYTATAREEEPSKIHKVRLKDLKPDTVYNYRISENGAIHENSFITAPGAPRPITFITLGDTRRWGGSLAETNMGDHMMQWNPEFIINNGDLVANGHIYQQWPEHFGRFHGIGDRIMVITARGNHEGSMIFSPENDWFNKYHDMPGDGEPYASFTWGNTHFVLVSYEQTPGAGQFLRKHMPGVDSQYKITAQHFPMYCSGYFGPDNSRKEYGYTLTDYALAIDEFNIDLHISGHTHIYERLHPIRGNKRDRTGCTYVVNGGDIGGQYPDWFTVVNDDPSTFEQPTYTVFHMGDDHIWFRTFAWNKLVKEIQEIDYHVIWKDEALPKAQLAKLSGAKGQELLDVITELGAMAYAPAAPQLIKHLDSQDEQTRRAAAQAIKLIGNAEITAQLLPHLDHADIQVRRELARGIEIAMDPAAAGEVSAQALNAEQDAVVRAHLAAALQFHGDKALAHDTLLTIVKDTAAPDETRNRAAYWLINICGPDDVDALAELFKKEEKEYVVKRLAWTLGEICGIQQNLDKAAETPPGDGRAEYIEKWTKWLERVKSKAAEKNAA